MSSSHSWRLKLWFKTQCVLLEDIEGQGRTMFECSHESRASTASCQMFPRDILNNFCFIVHVRQRRQRVWRGFPSGLTSLLKSTKPGGGRWLDNSAVWGSTSGNITMPHVFSPPRKAGNVLEKVSRRQPVVAEVTVRISVEFYDTQSPANLAEAGGWGGD